MMSLLNDSRLLDRNLLTKVRKNSRRLLHVFKNLVPAYHTFLNIKKVALLAHITISDELTFYNTVSTQSKQQPESNNDEDIE